MKRYIADTAFAARGLFTLMGDDDRVLRAKHEQLATVHTRLANAQAIINAGPPPTAFGEDTGPYFEKKGHDARRETTELEVEVAALKAGIIAKETSVQAIAGAILQIAKQGIAVVHGSLVGCPDGRSIGRETLKNVIWQARNQSMHWEENKYHPSTELCFANLQSDFGADFQLPAGTPRPLAKQVFRILTWTDYESYERDMISLLG